MESGSIGALVRTLDYDRYLAAVFAPAPCREALFALLAFNQEVARISEAVSEPMLGRIRLQWWREAVDDIYAGRPARRHAAALPLAATIRTHRLDRVAFDGLLDARKADFDPDPPANLAALERYAAATDGALTALMLAAAGAASEPAREAGRRVGTAWALVGTLRAAAHHAAHGRVMLPADLLARAGVAAGEVRAGRAFGRYAAAAAAVARRATELLDEARETRRAVPRRARAVLLTARLADLYLARLRRAAYDPRDRCLALSPLRKQWAMLPATLAGRY